MLRRSLSLGRTALKHTQINNQIAIGVSRYSIVTKTPFVVQNQSIQFRSYAKNKKQKEESSEKDDSDFDSDKLFKETRSNMEKYIDQFKKELSSINVGRTSPALIEDLVVTLPTGERRSIKQLGGVSVRNNKQLDVNVFDKSHTSAIVKAIKNADLGLNPQEMDMVIQVPIPKLTKEVRDNLVKNAKKQAEVTKENIRGVRRNSMNSLKKAKKSVSEDLVFKLEKQLQTIVDEHTKKIDKLFEDKEKEITSV
ncbi:ribosome-recycling factor [Acrasis kona]|uniref:Ribosome-recycling factor n=1 Tax=Acrasis kona TaxID=1008807 RepID=A0AAW2ZN50_9EUKA